MMTDLFYKYITEFIYRQFELELSKPFVDYDIIKQDKDDLEYLSFIVEWWYDEPSADIYIYYDTDYHRFGTLLDIYGENEDWIHQRIYNRLLNIYKKDFDNIYSGTGLEPSIHCKILPPAMNYMVDKEYDPRVSTDFRMIRPYTFTYWKSDGKYTFIENRHKFISWCYQLMIKEPEEWKQKVLDFRATIPHINDKYSFQSNKKEIFEEGFAEYNELFTKTFGLDPLVPIPDEDVNRFYIIVKDKPKEVVEEEPTVPPVEEGTE